MAVEKVMVIGPDKWGLGLPKYSAQSGFQVKLNDIAEENLQKGIATIENIFQEMLKKVVWTKRTRPTH